MGKSIRVVLSNTRCIYPRLFKADEYMGKSNYSIGLLLPEGSENLKKVQQAILEAVREEYGSEKANALVKKFAGSRTTWPLKKRDAEDDSEGYMIQPKRSEEKGKPKVVDRRKNPITEDGVIFGGCWVNASIDVYCYSNNGGGVTTYLNGVQFVKEDAPLAGSAASCEQDFDDLGDDGSVEGEGEDLPF